MDMDIFHPEMRSEKNPGWKMCGTQARRGFQSS